MTQTESEIRADELKQENKQLREALRVLAYEIEASNRDIDVEPDTSIAREITKQERERDAIKPPWEREGYESKQTWIDSN